ncbi:NACHT, LRR and PYD domains-containing protein 12-like isoform X2 [Sardina pilchardus]|uniref:NACHT, LRR and PYD domains-containing protein 12-like isoform X2 n=1 Tax=Sardina pilchardus TaxID=27697 RepID=UPI002E0E474F
MSDSQEREEAVGPSETLRPESAAHGFRTMKNAEDMADPGSPTHSGGGYRPPSPVPSCVSMKSDVSLPRPPNFSNEPPHSGPKSETHRPPSPVPSCVSMKSDVSLPRPPNFSSEPPHSEPKSETHRPPSPVPSCVSMKSDVSLPRPPNFSNEPPHSEPNELTADQLMGGVHEQVLSDTITCEHNINKRTDKEVLISVKEKHKASLKRRFENISEGIIKPGAEILLNKIYTELYITEGESEGVNKEHEVWQVESASRSQYTEDTPINCNDIFKPLPGQEKCIRTVMTKGVAGIGKTVSVQKFILDWTVGIVNQDIDFMFPLSFRELNLVRDDQYSLHKLLLDFQPELKELNDGEGYKDCRVVFIFDGLDESRLTLDFEQKSKLSDVEQESSMDLLMTSLIQGTLLPSALIWITSRPAAASQVPTQYIDQVTEVRGFNDPQKDEYFRKKISDESQANRIISHIKASRSLHIMCHIPVFCWIAATVLQQMQEQDNTQAIPTTLTEMFIHFLLIQTTRKNQKYQERHETENNRLLESQKEIILKLAEMAFDNLEEGKLIFYEEDLQKCGIDVSEASVYSGMCTEIFKEDSVFHQRKVYCFVHLSIQEFLAALHVFISHLKNNFKTLTSLCYVTCKIPLNGLLKKVVDQALKSRNGHLDLFLRFLMGISLESNQRLLQGLLNHTYSTTEMEIKNICQYIKEFNNEGLSPERCINLFYCLVEMNDHSMHQEIKKYLESPKDFKGQLSPAHCSALAHMLLMSEEMLDEFDLKKYNTSDEGRRRLIPAVRCFRRARLADCKLTDKSCDVVASVLQSPNSLIELELSNNDLGDSGVQLLSKGLSSPHCKLQILRLCKCDFSSEGYVCLALALMLNPSCVKELDVSYNHPGESAQKLLSATLKNPHSKVEVLQLAGCKLTDKSCETVTTVLQSPNSLIELDLSNNDLGDSGVQLLSKGLSSPHCKLQTLRLTGCKHTEKSCKHVASVLQSPNSLIELDLSNNDLGDSGVQLLSKGLSSPHCKLQMLRLCKCGISGEGYVCLALALMLNPSCVKELDVSNNHPRESAQKLLSATLEDPHSKVEALQLAGCKLTDKSCEIVTTVLQSPNSLIELDLSNNDLGDSGVQLLSKGLSSPHCKLQTLRLTGCKLTEKSCKHVASVLQSPNSLIELDLSNNDLGDSGVQLLSKGLSSPHCKLQMLRLCKCGISDGGYVCLALALMLNPSCVKELDVSNNHPGESAQNLLSATLEDPHSKVEAPQLTGCKLTDKSCELLASVLKSPNSLIELDLSNKDLGDSGVQILSKGLSSPHCKLQILRLCKCGFSSEGYVCLALALMVNPSCVKELDVSNNHSGESAQKLLSATLKDPHREVGALQLAGCKLTYKSCELVASVLQSPNSLIKLDMETNDLGDSGAQLLSKGLSSPHCRLQTLSLRNCSIGEEGFTALASALRSNPSHMRVLQLSGSKATDSGVKHLSSLLEDPNCKLEMLNLQNCSIGEEGFTALASALRSNPSHMRQLLLMGNKAGDSGVKHLSSLLEDPNCKLYNLDLMDCSIGEEGFTALASALRSNPSHMRELWLRGSKATDSGVKHLSSLLEDPNCKLEKLNLMNCSIGEEGFTALASALRSNPSHMRELYLRGSKATDSGVKHLSSLLEDPNCKLEILELQNCSIGEEGFTALASALRSNPSHMRALWLGGSKATESGVKHLSSLLEDPNCKLEKLDLNNCSIGEEGFTALASALRSNPSHMRELGLTGNKAGDSGVKHLSSLLEDPNCKLEKL